LVAAIFVAVMVEQFGKDVDPATGTMVLPTDGSPFRAALEASLRAKGYAIGPGGEGRAVSLAFVVDRAGDEVMAPLSTETLDLTRTQRETARPRDRGPRRRARSRSTVETEGRGETCPRSI